MPLPMRPESALSHPRDVLGALNSVRKEDLMHNAHHRHFGQVPNHPYQRPNG